MNIILTPIIWLTATIALLQAPAAIALDPPEEPIIAGQRELITDALVLGGQYFKFWPPITNSIGPQQIEHTIAAITSTVVTNVTSGDNHSGCSICDGIAKNFWAVYHECNILGPYVPATERWTTWTVTTDRQITLNAPGVDKPLTFWHSTPITNWTVREVRNSEWKPKPPEAPLRLGTNWSTFTGTNTLNIVEGGTMTFKPITQADLDVVNANLLVDLEAMIRRILREGSNAPSNIQGHPAIIPSVGNNPDSHSR